MAPQNTFMKAETVAAALIGKAATYSNTGPERRKVRIEMRKKAEK